MSMEYLFVGGNVETDSFCHWDFRDGHLKVADFPPQVAVVVPV